MSGRTIQFYNPLMLYSAVAGDSTAETHDKREIMRVALMKAFNQKGLDFEKTIHTGEIVHRTRLDEKGANTRAFLDYLKKNGLNLVSLSGLSAEHEIGRRFHRQSAKKAREYGTPFRGDVYVRISHGETNHTATGHQRRIVDIRVI